MTPRSLGLALACVALFPGCPGETSPEDASPPDADADASPDASPPFVTVAPSPPRFTPCPEGWREVVGAGDAPTTCAPFAEEGPNDCPPDEAHYPGTAGCALVGDPCPADGWPVDLPAGAVLYVRAAAPPGGDGTRTAPFSVLADAVAAAPDDATLAVAPGSYGPVRIERPLSIHGACTEVILSSDATAPTIRIVGVSASLRNLRVSGSVEGIGVWDGSLVARGLVVDDVARTGLGVSRGTITVSRLKIDRATDAGLALALGSSAQLDHVAISGVRYDTVRTSGSHAEIRDAVSSRDEDGSFYFGVQSEGVLFERAAFLGNGAILGTGALTIELRDAVFFGPPEEVETGPGAIAAFGGGDLTLLRVRVERARALGVAVADPGGVLSATDVIVRDVLGVDGDAAGHGIELGLGAEGSVERTLIERASGVGILADQAETHLRLDDVEVDDVRPDATGTFGRALQVQTGARVTGSRVAIRRSHEVAVVAAGDDTLIELEELLVESTRARTCAECASAGIGVGAYLGGAISLTRFQIRDNALVGVQLTNDGAVDLDRGEVAENPVGVNVQVPDYDIGRLTSGVSFRDNGTNLDASDLPVPPATIRP